ncbi:hypothetical protein PPERSA_01798 [Pseudocohnilembus persalinus]|uniref:Kinase domain protein n=1 Tax=Pseudocohnilembus persalinus TaxID=266149 RepID=A0A0V0R1G9_PSEPJ|nr:hypothetical protein PPERSA_01798 [Pseudocohnilembus persalinus]|eukprot:KRX08337.1 hypothetical protein PPERSA_01798 [Pseudocohnilembus persalinus]
MNHKQQFQFSQNNDSANIYNGSVKEISQIQSEQIDQNQINEQKVNQNQLAEEQQQNTYNEKRKTTLNPRIKDYTKNGIIGSLQQEIIKIEKELNCKLEDLRNPQFDQMINSMVIQNKDKLSIDPFKLQNTTEYLNIYLSIKRDIRTQKKSQTGKSERLDTCIQYKKQVVFLTKSQTTNFIDLAVMKNLSLITKYCNLYNKISSVQYGIAFDINHLVFTCYESSTNSYHISEPYQIFDFYKKEVKVEQIYKVLQIIQALCITYKK